MALSQQTLDAIAAAVAAALVAQAPVASPKATSEAATHWKNRDLPCLTGACDKMFRSVTGQTYHVDNVHKRAAK